MQAKKFHATILNLYRKAVGNHFSVVSDVSDMFSDEALIDRFDLVSPMNMLRCARLQLFVRIAQKQPPQPTRMLMVSLDNDSGWVKAIKEDLKILAFSNIINTIDIKTAFDNFAAIKNPNRLIRKFLVSKFANLDLLRDSPSPPPAVVSHHCHLCDYKANTKQQVSVHLFSRHGTYAPIRRHIRSKFCPVCLLWFANRQCVVNHVSYRSEICEKVLETRTPVMTEAEVIVLEKSQRVHHTKLAHQGFRRHAVRRDYCFRMEGPIEFIPLPPERVSRHHALGIGRSYYIP